MAADDAMQFVEGIDFTTFAGDKRTIYAVIRALEIMGEATKRIPEDIRQQYPSIPWRNMAGMRDKLIHGYTNESVKLRTQSALSESFFLKCYIL